MPWLTELFHESSVAGPILILGLIAVVGLALGAVRVRGIRLGIAGVLFAGILFGHFHVRVTPDVLHFVRDFGLILFVFTIGLQVGPGFFASLRREGLALNLMAVGVVLLGVITTIVVAYVGGVEIPVAVGLFSGATTNTPSLAAAQEAIRDTLTDGSASSDRATLGYAVAYPFGILGILLTMVLTRAVFRIRLDDEKDSLARERHRDREPVERINLEVQNPNLNGMRIGDLPLLEESGVVISRICRQGQLDVAQPDTVLQTGDTILAVGSPERLEQLRVLVGRKSDLDLHALPGKVTTRRLIVTQKEVIGKTVDELDFLERHDVTITRLRRAGTEFTPRPGVRLQFADTVLAVGKSEDIDRVAARLGNSPRQLDHTELIPVFLGIALGILLGSWPIHLSTLPAPIKLGLAGGPLLVAIVLSRIHRIGPLVWYMPAGANFALREVGIVLFLACVGLTSGDQFVATLTHGDGLKWMGLGALITVAPLLITAIIARACLKLNFLTLCGLLAGSMTDPPALAFAETMTDSEEPTVTYAAVYPLTMILRVIAAQVMVIALSA
ncbi:MAG: putative transporter [Candidatus Hydrogenedentes bacterium]|nr:putative transporter [Candidatus Hydrogenedentota bacterium]